MATTSENLTRVQYAGRDFWTFFDDLKVQIQSKYGTDYNDFMESSVGVMLLDIISWACDTLSFYLDRQATDSYLQTAQTRTAVERLVRQLGYKMYGGISHSVDLSVTLNQSWGFEVTVPQGFQFIGPNDLIFEATQDTVFPASDVGPKTISVREGQSRTEIFVSDGTRNQVFLLTGVPDGKFLMDNSIELRVGGTLWEEYEFIEFEQTDHYEVGYGASPPKIRFGDGVAGNIPATGSEITVEYSISSGKAGFAASGTIESVVNKLRVSGNDIEMAITNPLASGGGSDGESITHAQAYAPRYYRTRNVAVTRDDFETLASVFSDPQFGAVAKAQAISSRSAADDLYLLDQLSTIRNAADDPYPTVQSESDAIQNTDLPGVLNETSETQGDVDEIQALVGTPEVISPPAAATGMYLTIDTAVGDLRDSKNNQDEIDADATDIGDKSSDIDENATNAYNKVNAIAGGAGTSQFTDADKAALIGWISAIQTDNGVIDSEKNNVVAAAAATKSKIDGVISALAGMKINMDTMRDDLDDIDDNMLSIDSYRSSISAHVTAIVNVVVDTQVTVGDACDNIFNHVDAFLSQNCKANLVEVPILVKDVDGFYREPSLVLQRVLQAYLDARKEPTVTVRVMSGGESLVEASMSIVLGVDSTVVKPVIIATAQTIVDDILKERNFGVSLYRSQITDPLAGLAGMQYVNVAITAPATKLDTSGNLIIEQNEVITKGTVTITTEDAE